MKIRVERMKFWFYVGAFVLIFLGSLGHELWKANRLIRQRDFECHMWVPNVSRIVTNETEWANDQLYSNKTTNLIHYNINLGTFKRLMAENGQSLSVLVGKQGLDYKIRVGDVCFQSWARWPVVSFGLVRVTKAQFLGGSSFLVHVEPYSLWFSDVLCHGMLIGLVTSLIFLVICSTIFREV